MSPCPGNPRTSGQFCQPGGFEDLGPLLERDGIDLANFAEATLYYTQFDGVRCALPLLADAYGLYVNNALLAEAGLDGRTDDHHRADRGRPGSSRSVPTTARSRSSASTRCSASTSSRRRGIATMFGADWVDEEGNSSLSTDPAWAEALTWQKELVDWYGYDELVEFGAGAGDEFSASNAFQTGKVAMNVDGEWRTAFIGREAPDLDYGTAPVPVDDDQPELHGSGYINGTIVGIPGNAANKEQAWALVKYLTTDDAALAKLSNGLRNVPSTKSSAESPDLVPDEKFDTFLEIFAHPESSTTPVTAVGTRLPGPRQRLRVPLAGGRRARPRCRARRPRPADRRPARSGWRLDDHVTGPGLPRRNRRRRDPGP